MTLTGDDAANNTKNAISRAEQMKAEKLEAAKLDAIDRDKEPFDLAILETMCDTSREGKLASEKQRQGELEWLYYMGHPEILTLAELAKVVEELNQW